MPFASLVVALNIKLMNMLRYIHDACITMDYVFSRRYYEEDNQYYNPRKPILFLEVNPLVPLGSSAVYEMIDAARQIGASMVLLEQRYMGRSLPTREFSVATLKELFTVPQSVQDVVHFCRKMKEKVPGIKIILFGCSNGGMIAALARKYYSEFVDGAIVSSAALRIQLEYEKYAEVLGGDFSNPALGGSDKCLAVLRDAHTAFGEKLGSPEGRRLLERIFGLCDGDLEGWQLETAFTLYGDSTGEDLEYNDPQCEGDYCNIQKICSKLANEKKPPLDMLADIYKANSSPGSCLAVQLQQYVSILKDIMNSGTDRMNDFHVCTTRGLFGTCSHVTCPFFTGHDRDWFDYLTWLCEVGFGLSIEEILEGIEGFKAYVGDFRTTKNILSINGDADPWYPSSIFKEGEGPEVEMVNGASHCYWCSADNE
ncbi:Thymus-specific serine protease [Perkinsus chesapeaki]|uniref:Thymus-specific serine protease n=1 Tax=Perkinsus chesapeaki TaxID=330153 RepID=A0A7J6L5V8_PERCH|nr:Thymus-specific serine protease [Perkinsus chesapeaki]